VVGLRKPITVPGCSLLIPYFAQSGLDQERNDQDEDEQEENNRNVIERSKSGALVFFSPVPIRVFQFELHFFGRERPLSDSKIDWLQVNQLGKKDEEGCNQTEKERYQPHAAAVNDHDESN
jgi:hypothetical protein